MAPLDHNNDAYVDNESPRSNQSQRSFNSGATGLEAVSQLLPSELKIAQRFNPGVKRKPFFQVPKWTTELLA
jgi:hypothetical protein